jgi:hypothetical protein
MSPSHPTRRAAFAFAALSLIAASACTPDPAAARASDLADSATGDSVRSVAASPTDSQPPASPRDSLAVNIGGADITVNYGRPSKRGRVLFNGLGDMKWGMVWRTGANEATAFTTSRPLAFGSATVPAGSYTLFTHLVENGNWELVVNKQTGQWGTAYDATQDLVRIPMTVTSTNPMTEQLTISVTPAGQGGGLTVAWDTYKAVANFTVK